uniref:Uncharacterized protein n=1 Tax=Arundo donax TaxID=35708 RepID=A0A0A9HFI5_ARUDO
MDRTTTTLELFYLKKAPSHAGRSYTSMTQKMR